MIPNIEAWTIVIPGAWNVRIFSPEWVSEHLLDGEKVDVEINLSSGLHQLRFSFNNIVFIPLNNKIIFGLKNYNNETLDKSENLAIKLLDILPQTPVNGLGINFGFKEDSPETNILSLFDINDISALSEYGCLLQKTEINRKFIFNDNIINLKHSFENGIAEIHLNYHYNIKSPKEATSILGHQVLTCRDLSYDFLSRIYGLTLEKE
jgi:hypothetical protein